MSRREFVVKCIIRTQRRGQLLTVLDEFNARRFGRSAFFRFFRLAETSCIKLVQNSQELASSLRPYSTLNLTFQIATFLKTGVCTYIFIIAL